MGCTGLWLPRLIVSLFVHEGATNVRATRPKCELVGTFSLITQAMLGLLCLSSLIIKRYHEYPVRRPWKVWWYDVSKQLVGAFGVHVFNVLLSIVKTSDDLAILDDEVDDDPCDWYFLSIVLDCTIGVYILYLSFSWINRVCKKNLHITEIDSGEYGEPPRFRAYLKQLGIYFLALMITKAITYVIVVMFQDQLLWITHNIILVWLSEYPDEIEIFMVMFVIPVLMNCLQLVLVDNFIQNQVAKNTNFFMSFTNMDDETQSQFERETERVFARETAKRNSYGASDE